MLGTLGLAAGQSLAQNGDAASKAAAKKHFSNGLLLLKAENFSGAVVEFEAAVSLFPTKNALFNLANTYQAIHRYADALETFSRLKTAFKSELSEEMTASVGTHEKEILAVVAELHFDITPPGAQISIDGQAIDPLGHRGIAILGPGEYRLSVTLAGYQPEQRTVRLTSGSTTTVSIALKPQTPSTASKDVGGPDTNRSVELRDGQTVDQHLDDGTNPNNRIWAWSSLGATVAAGAAAGVFWGLMGSKAGDYDDYNRRIDNGEIGPDDTAQLSEMDGLKDEAVRFNKLAIGFTAAAAVFAGVSAALFIAGRDGETESVASVMIDPGRITIKF